MGVVIYLLIQLEGLIKTIGILDVFDILIVAFILYRVYKMLENTRAITLTRGLLILLLLAIITSWLELHVINWLLQKIVTLLFVALPIVFQPELRRALEHIGEGGFFKRSMLLNYEEACSLVSELDKAVTKLSSTKDIINIFILYHQNRIFCPSGFVLVILSGDQKLLLFQSQIFVLFLYIESWHGMYKDPPVL